MAEQHDDATEKSNFTNAMNAKQARTQSQQNSLHQVDQLINTYSLKGVSEIDIGPYGYSAVLNESDDKVEKLLSSLKKDGFKIRERTNSNKLLLAYVISW